MSITGSADGPPYRLGVAIADIVSGMFAAQGVTRRSWRASGPDADRRWTSRCSTRWWRSSATRRASISPTDAAPTAMGNRHPTIVPYETIPAVRRRLRRRRRQRRPMAPVLPVTGYRPQTNGSQPTGSESTNYDSPQADARCTTELQPRAYWIERLKAAGVPCGSVRDLHEVFTDPQIAARDMIVELEHADAGMLKLVGPR